MSKKEMLVKKNVEQNCTLEKLILESKLQLMPLTLEFPDLNLYLLLKTLFQEKKLKTLLPLLLN
jgi:hypothetical protein